MTVVITFLFHECPFYWMRYDKGAANVIITKLQKKRGGNNNTNYFMLVEMLFITTI